MQGGVQGLGVGCGVWGGGARVMEGGHRYTLCREGFRGWGAAGKGGQDGRGAYVC